MPALEFLRGLEPPDQHKAFAYVSYLEEHGEELRRPLADYLGEKLYELRPKQVRILYAFAKDVAVILHAFRKKTDAVPPEEQQVATARLADFLRRYEQGLIRIQR